MFQQPQDGSSVRLKKSRNVAERLYYPDAVAGVLFVVDLLLVGYNVVALVL